MWPNDGEIDIVEAINLMTVNQMALHTTPGCFHTTPPDQLGISVGTNNNGNDCSTASGCVVTETKNTSYGAAFAQNGGGVWATQFDVSGILYVHARLLIVDLIANLYLFLSQHVVLAGVCPFIFPLR